MGKHRFLIVDDVKDSADSLALVLKLMGQEARAVYDGEEAVVAAGKLKPDVMLLDLGMPRVNGYETCRTIRLQSWSQGTLLIAVTGWGQEGDRRRTREAGFDLHFVKPVDPVDLLAQVARLKTARSGSAGPPRKIPARDELAARDD